MKKDTFKRTSSKKITISGFVLIIIGAGISFILAFKLENNTNSLITVLVLAVIFLTLLILFYLFHYFYRIPLINFVKSIQKMDEGNYKPLHLYGFKDVLDMGKAINSLCDSLINEAEKRKLLNNEINSIAELYSGLYRYDSRTDSVSCLRRLSNVQQIKCENGTKLQLNHFMNTILHICHDDDCERLSFFFDSLVTNNNQSKYLDDIDIRILTDKGMQWTRIFGIFMYIDENKYELFFAFMDTSQTAIAEAGARERDIVFESKYKQLLGYVVFNLSRMEMFNSDRGGKLQRIFMEQNQNLFHIENNHLENELLPEYRKSYIDFLNIDNIQTVITDNIENPHLTYQLLNGEWHSIFIFRSTNYRPDNQEIVIYMENANQLMLENKKYQALVNKAEAANTAKTRFLQGMSHDIRTPMNAIIGMIEIARSSNGNMDRIFDCLNKIESSSSYLLGIINNALDMSRVESGNIKMEQEPVDMAGLLEVFRTVTNSMVASKYQKIFINAKPIENMVIIGDRTRLLQIMVNIVSNSTKYSDICAQIDVDFSLLPQQADSRTPMKIIIRDNGIGVSPEFLKKMFTPFERERDTTTTNVPGTGLGLSIVKSLVDLMDGYITCESTKNVGTTMTIVIPFQVISNEKVSIYSDEDDYNDDETSNNININEMKSAAESVINETTLIESAESINRKNAGITDLTGKRVLIVEDNEINMEIASLFVKRTGANVTEAWNGKEAVSLFKLHDENYFDIILMDIQMPVMDGYEATKVIRQLKRDDAKKIKIIAMSANVFSEDIQNSINAGMNAHVGKPINLKKLYNALSLKAD